MHFGVVLLAAGVSSRMGRPKMLLPWNRTSVLGHLLSLWKKVGAAQVAVVLAGADEPVSAELDRLGFPVRNRVENPMPERGMFSSIQCAARWDGWEPILTHWIVVLGDQPHVRTGTLQRLIDFAEAHSDKITQPSRNGRPRHPVVLPRVLFLELATSVQASLREFLRMHTSRRIQCEIEDPGLDQDMDYPADYERLKRLFDSQPDIS